MYLWYLFLVLPLIWTLRANKFNINIELHINLYVSYTVGILEAYFLFVIKSGGCWFKWEQELGLKRKVAIYRKKLTEVT